MNYIYERLVAVIGHLERNGFSFCISEKNDCICMIDCTELREKQMPFFQSISIQAAFHIQAVVSKNIFIFADIVVVVYF